MENGNEQMKRGLRPTLQLQQVPREFIIPDKKAAICNEPEIASHWRKGHAVQWCSKVFCLAILTHDFSTPKPFLWAERPL